MDNNVTIKCLNNSKVLQVKRGTSLFDAIGIFDIKLGNRILGALVNNELEDLAYEIYQPKTIQFIDITHPDGMRMYTRSLSFLLYKAVKELYPDARLIIDHSIAKGIFCKITGTDFELTDEAVSAILDKMRFYVKADFKFIRIIEETQDVIKKITEQGLYDKINLLKFRGRSYKSYYILDGCINFFYGYLVPSTSYINVFELNRYFDGMLLRLPKKNNPDEVEELTVQKKMFTVFQEFSQWNEILQVSNLSELNDLTFKGKSETLIKISEALHEKKIAQIADVIHSRKDKIKIILISGPSSSGKTTFSKRLAIQLLVNGIKPLNISLDNYFVDREKTPRTPSGDYDFEAFEAIDVDLFNQQIAELLNGKKVILPKFSFENGKKSFNTEPIEMKPDNILIIEGIHGLNPKLTPLIPEESKFMIYISALTTLNIDDHNWVSTRDNRLIRRIVRDYRYRKYTAQETIARWPSVIEGEEKHIFPFQEKANVIFNSALVYELAVLKYYADPLLREIQQCQPEYSEAKRLLNFLSYFRPIKTWEIPPTSILREFLGGSSFSY